MRLTGPGIIVFFALVVNGSLAGQNTETPVRLPFKFTDGIFQGFGNVLRDSPVKKESLLIATDFHDADFFRRIILSDQIRYLKDDGTSGVIETSEVWGFAAGGLLYVKYRGVYSPVYMLGRISCFFLHDDNFRKYSRLLNEQYLMPETGSPVPGEWADFGGRVNKIHYRKLKKYILDFRTGSISRLNRANLSGLLAPDRGLSEEFKALPPGPQRALLFYYIGAFNEKNPLYLPMK